MGFPWADISYSSCLLGRAATVSYARARQHRHHGQPLQPQECRRQSCNPGKRRATAVAAVLQPRPNPIEQVFAKLKHLLRKAAERTQEATWRRIGTLLSAFSPHECANYLVNSGYASMYCNQALDAPRRPRAPHSRNQVKARLAAIDILHRLAIEIGVLLQPEPHVLSAPFGHLVLRR